MRTKNASNNNIIVINEGSYFAHLYDIKQNSDNNLNHFHVADGLPADLAQDLFEGSPVDIVSNVVVFFIRKRLFDLDGLNEIILNFAYSESNKNHKPQFVKLKPLKSLKFKQTACEMWTSIRIFPVMIGSFISLSNK